jgi:hypothetical protein
LNDVLRWLINGLLVLFNLLLYKLGAFANKFDFAIGLELNFLKFVFNLLFKLVLNAIDIILSAQLSQVVDLRVFLFQDVLVLPLVYLTFEDVPFVFSQLLRNLVSYSDFLVLNV